MSVENQKFGKYNPPIQRWIVPLSIFLSIFIFGGTFFLTNFCPNFILDPHPKYFNLAEYIHKRFIESSNQGKVAVGYLYWIINGLSACFVVISNLDMVRGFVCLVTFRPWLYKYMDEHAKIINSCDPNTFSDRVALIVTVCNDLTENTILQTKNQTYKNLDCWILDDSFKPKELERIKKFLLDHPEIKYYRRTDENRKAHPSQIGNIIAWVNDHGNEYDYVFETNTSSLATNTFVENCLCYYHSPILKDYKIGGITTYGGFYYSNTIVSWITAMSTQFIQNHERGTMVRGSGNDVYMHGWGCFYCLAAIKSVNLQKAECPACDMARGAEMTTHGFKNFFNPFDFTAKVSVRDMDGFRNQRIKWNGGWVHLFRNKVNWGPGFKNQPLAIRYVTFLVGWNCVFFLVSFTFKMISAVFGIFAVINFPNFTSILFIAVIWTIVVVPLVILGLKNKATLRIIFGWMLSSLLQRAIYYFRLYYVIFKFFIGHKWSAAAITKKTNKNYTVKEKIKLCWKDALWILILTTICLVLQFAAHLPPFTIWYRFYRIFIIPSILFILFVFLGEIRIPRGWNPEWKEWPDFYKTIFDSYRIVKNSEVWKKQHPEKL